MGFVQHEKWFLIANEILFWKGKLYDQFLGLLRNGKIFLVQPSCCEFLHKPKVLRSEMLLLYFSSKYILLSIKQQVVLLIHQPYPYKWLPQIWILLRNPVLPTVFKTMTFQNNDLGCNLLKSVNVQKQLFIHLFNKYSSIGNSVTETMKNT